MICILVKINVNLKINGLTFSVIFLPAHSVKCFQPIVHSSIISSYLNIIIGVVVWSACSGANATLYHWWLIIEYVDVLSESGFRLAYYRVLSCYKHLTTILRRSCRLLLFNLSVIRRSTCTCFRRRWRPNCRRNLSKFSRGWAMSSAAPRNTWERWRCTRKLRSTRLKRVLIRLTSDSRNISSLSRYH